MARDKLKDFLRVNAYGGSNGTEEIQYIVDQQGDGTADPYVDDLKGDIKKALGDYASFETKENKYRLKDGMNHFKLTGDDGKAAAYDSGDGGAENAFFQQDSRELSSEDLRAYFDTISGGSTPDAKGGGTFDPNQIRDVLDKSGKDGTKAGDTTLRDARNKKLISPVLTQFNRFHPDGKSPYNASGSPMTAGQVDGLPFVSKQNELGEYDNNSANVKLKAMKDIGQKLVVAATGHSPTQGAFLAGLLPSLQQLGASKTDPNDMLARNVEKPGFGGGNKDTKGSSVTKVYDGYRAKSFGALNSPLEPFGATPKLGMTTLVVALVLAVGLLVDLVAMIIGALILPLPSGNKATREATPEFNPADSGRMGVAFQGGGAALVKPSFFGVRPTRMDFVEATSLGTEIFFGEIDDFHGSGGGLFSFLPGGRNINDSPGYYAIVFRAVVRSTIEIGLAFGDIFKGGLFAALGAIADLFDTIRNSKLVGYMNMLAALGDIYEEILEENSTRTVISKSKSSTGGLDTKVSELDADILQAGTQELRVSKSRYTMPDSALTLGPTLVWRQGAAPSTYLLNADTIAAADAVGQGLVAGFGLEDPAYQYEFSEALGDDSNKQQVVDSGQNRLPSALVKKIEDLADGEYMPFYFHDLRTNEIVGFHAFLTSLTDSYTANYDSNQGYGRADPVMIYNNTQRSIGMTFWVVSTNEQDFDEMWWKINKLTTLMYPQYSAGTQVTAPGLAGDNPFTAPFSQVIAASPMIRLRLGDLFRSNYSKFGLARIFGLDQHTDVVGSVPASDIAAAISEVEAQSADLKLPPLLGGIQCKFITKRRVALSYKKDDKKRLRKIYVPAGLMVQVDGIDVTVESLEKFLATGDLAAISRYGIATVEVIDPATHPDHTFTKNASKKFEGFQKRAKNKGISDLKFVVPYNLVADTTTFKLFDGSAADAGASSPREPAENTDLVTFLDADTNPVTKAFESTMGKGLAGFITSMDFQWLDQITWETEGSKAPKACAITISYSPVHDIGPGLAHDGMNRAPIYNAGSSVNKLAGRPYHKSTEGES